jgi:hypothetical protein
MRKTARMPIVGGRLVLYGEPTGREGWGRESAGRVCNHPGCSTILSTYNTERTCSIHTAPDFRHVHRDV